MENQFKEKVEENIEQATKELNLKIKQFDDLLKDTKEERNKNIEILALFATLFTFISINVQVFNTLQTLSQALIFIILFGLVLLVFLIVFFSYSRDVWIKSKEAKNWWDIKKLITTGIILLLIIVPICLTLSFFTDWFGWMDRQKTIPKCRDTKIVAECIITEEDIKKIIDDKSKLKNP